MVFFIEIDQGSSDSSRPLLRMTSSHWDILSNRYFGPDDKASTFKEREKGELDN